MTDTILVRRTAQGDQNDLLCSPEQLWEMALKFAFWLEKTGYASYDPYDVWGTRYGLWARRLYYRKNPMGLALIAPGLLLEIFCPRLRALFIKKERFPTADAQLVLAFLNLHELSRTVRRQEPAAVGRLTTQSAEVADKDQSLHFDSQTSTPWLIRARDLAEELRDCSIRGYSGDCWGYPFDWQNVSGLMPKHTPHITATPYCYEAFTRLFDATGETRYLDIARSAATFVFHDLNDTPMGSDAMASSYSPQDSSSKVINASAYRAFVLYDAGERFDNEPYREKAWKNLRFILQEQRADGSWLYAIDNPTEAFIDHFHTCFVLKNLYKLNRILGSDTVARAIIKGYRYYREALYDDDDKPKSFALAPRTQIVRLEMYNIAEAITLGSLLSDEIPEARALACKLARRLHDRYQCQEGYFVTRVYYGGFKHTLPFLRWPQAQLFLAITNLLRATQFEGLVSNCAR